MMRLGGVPGKLAALVFATVLISGGKAAPAAAKTDPPPARNTGIGKSFRGDLISEPDVMPTDTIDYLYSSGAGGTPHIPMRTFTTMGAWSNVYDVLPAMPPWALSTWPVWSPDVRKVGRNYVMWFAAYWKAAPGYRAGSAPLCLGVATSSSPFGPFVSQARVPTVCQLSNFGDLDPRTVEIGKQEWLLWKSDDNSEAWTGKPCKIFIERLGSDGRTLKGRPTQIYQSSAPWEGNLVESPDMVKQGNRYWLFFSGNASKSPTSGVGLASCRPPPGPCTSIGAGPWLGSNLSGAGPDEESLFQQDGAEWLLYTPHALYYPFAFPILAVARVAFSEGVPYVATFDGARPGPTG
jgi:arabinan endo-1,5-alpha-L-arabinosidase